MIGKEINEFKARLADAKELFRVSVGAVEKRVLCNADDTYRTSR